MMPNWRIALLVLVPAVWGALELSREVRTRLGGRDRGAEKKTRAERVELHALLLTTH